jgi:DNA-directed RNA polymerase specialized sigma24 family protein
MAVTLEPNERQVADDRVRWAADVRDALATLRLDEQTFIRASYFDGQLHSSIAERAGLPVASVSRTISNGMRRLTRILERAAPARTDPP